MSKHHAFYLVSLFTFPVSLLNVHCKAVEVLCFNFFFFSDQKHLESKL